MGKKSEPIVFGVGRLSGGFSTMQIMSPERDSSKNAILEGIQDGEETLLKFKISKAYCVDIACAVVMSECCLL